ncbi:MAG: serine/threonine-protein kinase, partial [Pseudomonadota bacterium]
MDRTDPAIEREAMAALEEALDLPSDERRDFVRSKPSLSQAVKDRATALLQSIDAPVSSLLTGGASAELEDEAVPDQIGAYRILRLIGRGGMGNVYLGERAAQDFDHAVAIKVIKKRLINPHLIERFRAERQILADLNHPNIARLFDGGETEAGAPYFVMEFVDGVPLNQWIELASRSLEERIQVFLQICAAVETAHQRLIIHRDLTPPNILITPQNVVKIIDFGIARSEQSDHEGKDSSFGHTPGFAAPELASHGAA